MNSGAQCPGFKSQLVPAILQAWWLSLEPATHAGPQRGAARPAETYRLSRAILCTCQNPEAVGRW